MKLSVEFGYYNGNDWHVEEGWMFSLEDGRNSTWTFLWKQSRNWLYTWKKRSYLKERSSLLKARTCRGILVMLFRRSGILVLVNDVDWEVLDREKTELNVWMFWIDIIIIVGGRWYIILIHVTWWLVQSVNCLVLFVAFSITTTLFSNKYTLMNRTSGIIPFTLISTSLCHNPHHNPSVSNVQSPSIILSDYRKNRGCVLIYEIRQLGRRWLRKCR